MKAESFSGVINAQHLVYISQRLYPFEMKYVLRYPPAAAFLALPLASLTDLAR